jgi:hypothetical protein
VQPEDARRRWITADRLEEFEPVAVRVGRVEPAHAGELVVETDGIPGGGQPAGPLVDASNEQTGVRLAGRPEVGLHAEVQFDAVTAEPAAALAGQRRRLVDLGQAEHPGIERARAVLGPGRARQQHVMDHGQPPSACFSTAINLDVKRL